MAASHYAETLGVPALFPRLLFPELLALAGDSGAKPLLFKYRETVAPVPFPEGATDIDWPADIAALKRPPGQI